MPSLTKEQREQIQELLDAGEMPTDIAAIMGLSVQAVLNARPPDNEDEIAVYSRMRGMRDKPLDERLEAVVNTIVDVLPRKLKGATLSQCSQALRETTQALLLLRKQPTSIVATRSVLTDDERARRIQELLNEARTRAGMMPLSVEEMAEQLTR